MTRGGERRAAEFLYAPAVTSCTPRACKQPGHKATSARQDYASAAQVSHRQGRHHLTDSGSGTTTRHPRRFSAARLQGRVFPSRRLRPTDSPQATAHHRACGRTREQRTTSALSDPCHHWPPATPPRDHAGTDRTERYGLGARAGPADDTSCTVKSDPSSADHEHRSPPPPPARRISHLPRGNRPVPAVAVLAHPAGIDRVDNPITPLAFRIPRQVRQSLLVLVVQVIHAHDSIPPYRRRRVSPGTVNQPPSLSQETPPARPSRTARASSRSYRVRVKVAWYAA